MIAKIAVSAAPFAIDKPYSYRIPAEISLVPGARVVVPFGRGNRQAEGIVLSVEEGSSEELKTVECCLDQEPLISDTMLRLAAFLRDRCFCSFYDCVRAMLPAGLWFREKNIYALTEDRSWQERGCRQQDALAVLNQLLALGGQAEESALRSVVPEEEKLQAALGYLSRKKWISGHKDLSRKTGDKTEKIATLAAPAEEVMAYAAQRPKSAAMQRSVLELMCSIGSVSVKELCYFTGASSGTVKRLADLGFLELSDKPVLRCREIRPAVLDGPLVLNAEQQKAYEGLLEQLQSPKPGTALLYGVTGSGKTSVYLKLIQSCLDSGKSAMLLVPEIALTPQLLSLLAAHFGDQVAIQHSSLSAGERYDQWNRIRRGEARVVVGTRSAVFAPCVKLGLVILDEEQEASYRSENNPRYDAREVALWRGWKEQAMVLLGSATPSVETMYRAKTGTYRLYTLTERFNGRPLPTVEMVDMRQELRSGNDSVYSTHLREEILTNWQRGKQTVLLLNRRGNSRSMVCIDCAEAPECVRCSAKLTYHSANGRLMCHYCGYSQQVSQRCPTCGGPLKTVGVGTQKAELELKEQLPGIECDRMDTDTVNAVNTHEKILSRFRENRTPVLIGTQMVAKGLNLPEVTLVGVLDGDLSLYSGGYRAAQTTFNMLTQVIGRAGRFDETGRAVIQTLVPNHKVLQLAAKQDYDGFYELELQLRKAQGYPPFGDLVIITFSGQEEAQVLRGAVKFRDSLSACLKAPDYVGANCQILGPAPCVVPKINYNYRYRLTLRCKLTQDIRMLLGHMLRQFLKDSANRGVSAFVDGNGTED